MTKTGQSTRSGNYPEQTRHHAPAIDAELNALPDYGANISWNLSRNSHGLCDGIVIKHRQIVHRWLLATTRPDQLPCVAQTITNASLIGSVDCPLLYRYVTKYAYVYAVDPASLNSGVITAVNTIPAETLTLSKPSSWPAARVISRAGKRGLERSLNFACMTRTHCWFPAGHRFACFNSISVSAGVF